MKKGLWIVTAIILLAGVSFVSAEDMKGGMMEQGDKGSMMGGGMMGMMGDKKMMGMCPMMGGMMSSMMGKSMAATSDGGVIVMSGNKLTKYDKDLNVVKEVEIKMDMAGMQNQMMDMMKNCPMMGKATTGGMDKSSDKTENATTPASDEVDHASHHK